MRSRSKAESGLPAALKSVYSPLTALAIQHHSRAAASSRNGLLIVFTCVVYAV